MSTSEPCRRRGCTAPRVTSQHCRACADADAERSSAYRAAHLENVRARQREYSRAYHAARSE